MIGTRVASRKLFTCAAPSYLAVAGRPDTVEKLAEHECIVGTSPTWRFRLGAPERHTYRYQLTLFTADGRALPQPESEESKDVLVLMPPVADPTPTPTPTPTPG